MNDRWSKTIMLLHWRHHVGARHVASARDEPTAPVLGDLLSRQVHGALAIGVLRLVAAHIGGVFVHQRRQGGTLRHMVPFPR